MSFNLYPVDKLLNAITINLIKSETYAVVGFLDLGIRIIKLENNKLLSMKANDQNYVLGKDIIVDVWPVTRNQFKNEQIYH